MNPTPVDPRNDLQHPPAEMIIAAIKERIIHFLEHFCDLPMVDMEFLAALEGVTGEDKFTSLLARVGFADDANGFVTELVDQLRQINGTETRAVIFNGLKLPYQLLLFVMAELVPGGGYKTIKKVRQLEELTNTKVPPEEQADLQQVIDTFPVRLSLHTIRQMRLSDKVAYQYRPFVEELDPRGTAHTWVGQFFRGIVEQMYQNRVIFIMNMACPVYCRFCFRKHKDCRNQKSPNKIHVKQAVLYLQNEPDIKEVVLTGGDPFMNRATLQYAVAELAKIPHVQTLRLASRAVSYYPLMFLKDEGYWLNYLVRTNLKLQQQGKRLELATHFIHPDEISVDALDVISHLVSNGVPVYVQTPFVQGCNESGREMVRLFNVLHAAGAEIHYIFMPTSPIQGNSIYWSTIAEGLRAGRYLRANLSDRAMPHLTTATSIGKIDWNTSGWAVQQSVANPDQIWIRTPYTHSYYEKFAPIMQNTETVRPNHEGTLDATFQVEIGDADLFAGPRGLTSSPEAAEYKLTRTTELVEESLEFLQAFHLLDQRDLKTSIIPPPNPAVARVHKTRIEMDCGAPREELEAAYTYLKERPEITDVVLSRADDMLTGFSRTLKIIDRLREIPTILTIRLRSLKLNHQPKILSRATMSRLASRNRLQVVRSVRLELETQFLHSSEIQPDHANLARELRQRGITVYNNTPLLGNINDNEAEMLRISSACREAGIEFCNVYVCGLPIQSEWNEQYPIELNSVIDIATFVRRQGSGREVPRYVLRTPLGEVDFTIMPRIFEPMESGEVQVRLLEHNLEYFRALDGSFDWPDNVTIDREGWPLVPIRGVSLEHQDFLFTPPDETAK